jgi:hypothetical protein
LLLDVFVKIKNCTNKKIFVYLPILVTMAVACFASLAILAGSMAAIYGIGWYKDRRRQNRRLAKKSVADDGHVTTKEEQPIVEQVA